MTWRGVLVAWVLAGLALAGAAALLQRAAGMAPPLFHGARIAVIGSSQMRFAVSKQGNGATSLLGDGRSHYRIGLPAISEPETLYLLRRAIDEHAELVLLESHALLYDTAPTRELGRCDQPARSLRVAIKQSQLRLTDTWARWTHKPLSTHDRADPADLDNLGPLDPTAAGRQFPLHLRDPCDMAGLVELTNRARAQGTRLILLFPPRSASADRLMGTDQVKTLDAAASKLASDLHLEIFKPGATWRDDQFVSLGHVNRSGRNRFVAELQAWMRSRI